MADEVIEALEGFVLDNPELERLELILDRFSPFAAMGWVRQEVRHSQFLRWFLDPAETHGMGEYPLRRFIKTVAAKGKGGFDLVPSVIEADSWSYDGTFVLTEWNNIDVFVRNDTVEFCMVIENKVGTAEHSNQLSRYRELVLNRLPGYQKLFVYLTVEGEAPSDDAYRSVSYGEVAEFVAGVVERNEDQIGSEVGTFCGQYVEMLRRHIVEDSEVQELCQKIYSTHKRALDVLFEHRPDKTQELSDFLQARVEAAPELIPDHSSKSYVRFIPRRMDLVPRVGEGWTPSKRLVLCEIDLSDSGRFKVVMGPGDPEVRQAVFEGVQGHTDVFNRADSTLSPQWWALHSERWITRNRYENATIEEIKDYFERKLDQFVDKDLPKMAERFQAADFG